VVDGIAGKRFAPRRHRDMFRKKLEIASATNTMIELESRRHLLARFPPWIIPGQTRRWAFWG